jgi:hypothetical protein
MSLLQTFAAAVFEPATAVDRPGWDFCNPIFKKKLIDATPANGGLMRRRIKGQWQYRKMTAEDEAERIRSDAW